MTRSLNGNDRLSSLRSLVALMVLIVLVSGCGDSQPVAVDPQQLQHIQDHRRPGLQEGYSELFTQTTLVSTGALERAGKSVPYAELIDRPGQLRGQPIAIEGVLWRLYPLPIREVVTFDEANEPISSHEAWIVDGNARPYRVIIPRLSADLKPGDGLRSIRLTGYFVALECHELPHPEEFGVELTNVGVPLLFAPRIVLTQAIVPSKFDVQFVAGKAPEDPSLPPIQVRLYSDDTGKLTKLTVGSENLGDDDKAFEGLRSFVLKVIVLPGHPLTRDIEAIIDADAGCSATDVAKAVSACIGGDLRYIENIRYAVPHKPRTTSE